MLLPPSGRAVGMIEVFLCVIGRFMRVSTPWGSLCNVCYVRLTVRRWILKKLVNNASWD